MNEADTHLREIVCKGSSAIVGFLSRIVLSPEKVFMYPMKWDICMIFSTL